MMLAGSSVIKVIYWSLIVGKLYCRTAGILDFNRNYTKVSCSEYSGEIATNK